MVMAVAVSVIHGVTEMTLRREEDAVIKTVQVHLLELELYCGSCLSISGLETIAASSLCTVEAYTRYAQHCAVFYNKHLRVADFRHDVTVLSQRSHWLLIHAGPHRCRL
eukprot:16368-Heterococcus_DN1.PRE.6